MFISAFAVNGQYKSCVRKRTHKDDTVEALLEPGHRVLLLHPVTRANACLLLLPPCYPCTGSAHDDVEVHAEDTDVGVVAGTEIDVLLDTETEVAGLGEVLAAELVLLDLEAALEDLLRLRAADGDVRRDLFVAPDAERAHGVARFRGDGGLARQLLEHLGRPRQSVTGLADRDVWLKRFESKTAKSTLSMLWIG